DRELLRGHRDHYDDGVAVVLCLGGRPVDVRTVAAPWSGGASGAPSGLRGAGTVPVVADDVLGVEGRVPIPVLGVHAAEATGKDPLDLLDREKLLDGCTHTHSPIMATTAPASSTTCSPRGKPESFFTRSKLSPATQTGPLARFSRPARATSAGSETRRPGVSKFRPARSIAGVRVTPATSPRTSTPRSRISSHSPSAKTRLKAF